MLFSPSLLPGGLSSHLRARPAFRRNKLFGTDGAGGILNKSTKRANLTRTQTNVSRTTGSNNQLRGELDHNHVTRRAPPGSAATRG